VIKIVYLGWMIPTSEVYEAKLRAVAEELGCSLEKAFEYIIDSFEKNEG
jgi:hypothetical protein